MRPWPLFLLLPLAACAPAAVSATPTGPAAVVAGFADALRHRDGAAACALLSAPARADLDPSCAEEVLRLGLRTGPPGPAEVWGDAARVRAAGDTVFVSAYREGWRITGAGCESRGEDLPYACELGGP
ncbi:MAG TPA: hypothetical protein VGD72_04530 [Mycobacteriales bacterium]|jgi:hypothetical protein